MAGHDIIVVGASAGGIEAITDLFHDLPRDLPASIFVVVHIRAGTPNVLAQILGRATVLPTISPKNGDPIEPGRIYVCLPNYHLMIERGHVRLSRGPKENNTRPSIDPLFRSAAYSYGPRVIGVVLSGTLDDGTAGLLAIKKRGGIAVVQNPKEALYGDMPRNAIEHASVDYVVRISEMAPLLIQLVNTPASDEMNFPIPEPLAVESRIAERGCNPWTR
jgi:two-component system chemotaxis response regulator CheB